MCPSDVLATIHRAQAAQRAYYRRTHVQLALGEEHIMEATTERLEHLRGEIRAERISYAEIAELQGLAEHIAPGDVELLEWAGVPEHPEADHEEA